MHCYLRLSPICFLLVLGGCMTARVFNSKGKEATDGNEWSWCNAIPHGARRGDTVVPTLSQSAVVSLLPKYQGSAYEQTSWSSAAACRITSINGIPVHNLNDLADACAKVANLHKAAKIGIEKSGDDGQSSPMIEVDENKLLAVLQVAAPEEPVVRINADGNQWVVIRQDDVRCELMVRVERRLGLVHVVLCPGLCWGSPRVLPVDIRATCGGAPLACLSVADTLRLVYGGDAGRRADAIAPPEACSYQTVSERGDFLLPSNYRELQDAADQAMKRSKKALPTPAFASVPGNSYPGSPILGDARALSGFMLQRRVYHAGEFAKAGWVIFSGEAVSRCDEVRIIIDLGLGPQELALSLSGK